MCFETTSETTQPRNGGTLPRSPRAPRASRYLLSLVGRECPFQVFEIQDFEHFCVIYVGPHGACQLVLQDSRSIAGWGSPAHLPLHHRVAVQHTLVSLPKLFPGLPLAAWTS